VAISPEYLAGFFDGEGCVSIYIVKNPKYQCHVRTVIVNTNKEILQAINQQFSGYLQVDRFNNPEKPWKPFTQLHFQGERAIEFLTFIRPFSIIKKRQIDLAFEFWEFRKSMTRKERCQWDDEIKHFVLKKEIIEREHEFKNKMHDLNRKGLAVVH
jgi:LAGLIDADG endonuclease